MRIIRRTEAENTSVVDPGLDEGSVIEITNTDEQPLQAGCRLNSGLTP